MLPDAGYSPAQRDRRLEGDLQACLVSKVQIAADTVADDKFLGGLSFYVKGVEGKVPGGK